MARLPIKDIGTGGTLTDAGLRLAAGGAYRPASTSKRQVDQRPAVLLAAGRGAPVLAPEGGTVTERWTDNVSAPWAGWGPGGVVLRGDSGVWHVLGHMSPLRLAPLGRIEEGASVGTAAGAPAASPDVVWQVRTARTAPWDGTLWDIAVDPGDWYTRERARPATAPARASSGGGALVVLVAILLLVAFAGRNR